MRIPTDCLYCRESTIGLPASELSWTTLISEAGHDRVVVHIACVMRAVVGGINHQMRVCRCYGGSEPADPENISQYEAAKLAVAYWRRGGAVH
jgi:hypothetical protein